MFYNSIISTSMFLEQKIGTLHVLSEKQECGANSGANCRAQRATYGCCGEACIDEEGVVNAH